MEATRQIDKPTYKGILFRRTYPELEMSLILRAFEWYPSLGGKPKDSGKIWTFPSGATIRFGHLEYEKDVFKFQSAQFDFIGFDELTSFTEFQYLYMFSRCRGVDPTIRRYVRGGTNPGNVGHVWVKRRFVEGKIPYKSHFYKLIDGKEVEVTSTEPLAMSRAFIPARVWDNPKLIQNDPMYVERLKLLPLDQQKMLLDGDWDVFEGQFFKEWRRDLHVVEPFEIPHGWFRYRSIDYGRTNPFCCKWYAVDYDGNIWVYREHYQAGWTASENGARIKQLSGDEKYRYTMADPSIFSKTHLPETIADVLAREGVPCIPASNERIAGWNSYREYLAFKDNRPKIRYFSTCVDSIRTIPQLIHDKAHPEDLDSSGEDHAADTDRYLIQTLRQQKATKPQDPVMEKINRLRRSEGSDLSVEAYANQLST